MKVLDLHSKLDLEDDNGNKFVAICVKVSPDESDEQYFNCRVCSICPYLNKPSISCNLERDVLTVVSTGQFLDCSMISPHPMNLNTSRILVMPLPDFEKFKKVHGLIRRRETPVVQVSEEQQQWIDVLL